jgi:hypothetical protein
MTGRIGDLENCGTHGECAEWSTNRWIPFVRPRTIPGVLLQALGLAAAAAAARPPVSSPSGRCAGRRTGSRRSPATWRTQRSAVGFFSSATPAFALHDHATF